MVLQHMNVLLFNTSLLCHGFCLAQFCLPSDAPATIFFSLALICGISCLLSLPLLLFYRSTHDHLSIFMHSCDVKKLTLTKILPILPRPWGLNQIFLWQLDRSDIITFSSSDVFMYWMKVTEMRHENVHLTFCTWKLTQSSHWARFWVFLKYISWYTENIAWFCDKSD